MRIKRTEYDNIPPKVQAVVDDAMRFGAAIGTWLHEGNYHATARVGAWDAFNAAQETFLEAIDMEMKHWLGDKEVEWRKANNDR